MDYKLYYNFQRYYLGYITTGDFKALDLYLTNRSFRKLIDTNKYVYSYGNFYLKLPNGCTIEDGHIALKSDTIQFFDDFCISTASKKRLFRRSRWEPIAHQLTRALDDIKKASQNSDKKPTKPRKPQKSRNKFLHANKYESITQLDVAAFWEYLESQQTAPNDSFGSCLKYYIKRDGLTQEKLAEIIKMTPNTISRICNNEYIPPIETAVAICVALHLLPFDSRHLLKLMGYTLENGPSIFKVYQLIVDVFYESSVEDCNSFIVSKGFPSLINTNK